MQLVSLNITDFKNIQDTRLSLSPRFNGFLGLNGMGKSNLLDAIYALSFTKSFTGAQDRMLTRRGSEPQTQRQGIQTHLGAHRPVSARDDVAA